MKSRLPVSFLLASVFALSTTTATLAQGPCNDRTEVLGHLAKKYQEEPVAVGVSNKGTLIEVLSTGDGQTWTIIASTPQGKSCVIAAGEGWRDINFTSDYLEPKV